MRTASGLILPDRPTLGDAMELADLMRAGWPERSQRIRESGVPTADQQTWQVLKNAYATSGTTTGVTLASSAAWAAISPGGEGAQGAVFPEGSILPGMLFRLTAAGQFSTTGKPALSLAVLFGAPAEPEAENTLAQSVAITTLENAAERIWHLEVITRVLSIGAEGKLLTRGFVMGLEAGSGAAASASVTTLPEKGPSTGSLVNLNKTAPIFLSAKWGTSNAANKITCDQWLV